MQLAASASVFDDCGEGVADEQTEQNCEIDYLFGVSRAL
jgi:hypothetical protein